MTGILEMIWMIFLDLLFVGLLVLLMVPLGLYKHAAFAVMKRNFVGYFSNPTGYVFLCLFVLLTSFAAFCLPEFFTSNLANFDQLNKYLPLIMLVFIPAITMSIWAEERRQGTDELLLTLPAADFDIVMGKYLAAVMIFTVSLIFSQLCNFAVLILLTGGDLDSGLLFTTYFGYWLTGIAMLAIGMVASFLTNNLTVGFVFGVLFNAPLVLLAWAEVAIPYYGLARFIARWSFLEQFDNFGRGIISLSSITYFVMIAAVCLYISMVLIGRRHWRGGRDGSAMLGHYLARAVSLVLIAAAVSLIVENTFLGRIIHLDTTRGQVSSLHPETVKLIRNLNKNRPPVVIDAFIGDVIPPDYVKTRNELIARLKDFKAKSGGRVQVNINEGVSPFSEKATEAEQRFDIKPQQVRTQHRGAIRDEQVILAAAFTCGLERVVVPFFDYGIPVEYELIRSINTVSKGQRKKLGVLDTDARLMGGFTFAGGMPTTLPKQPIIDELEKQYDIQEVNPNNPILEERYDPKGARYAALLVVQPSSLTQEQLDNLLEAIRNGQPTAIFEDPFPAMINCPGTSEPKRNPMMGMFGGGTPPPKGDIQQLWDLLGIKAKGKRQFGTFQPDVVWQRYNPYRKLRLTVFGPEWVFISPAAPGAEDPFNPDDKITSGLNEVLFPMPGCFEPKPDAGDDLKFTKLVETGFAGTIGYNTFRENQRDALALALQFGAGLDRFTLAARITSKPKKARHGSRSEAHAAGTEAKNRSGDQADEPEEDGDDQGNGDSEEAAPNINVVYVSDIDLLSADFVRVRAQPDQEMNWKFENITFVLNILDVLSGDDEYITIRKRKPQYSTLRRIEQKIKQAQDDEYEEREKYQKQYREAEQKAEKENEEKLKKFEDKLEQLKKRQEKGEDVLDEVIAANQTVREQRRALERSLAVKKASLQEARDKKIEMIRREKEQQIENIQTFYRAVAVVLPPIPPILIGIVVLVWRLLREREGISKARLRD